MTDDELRDTVDRIATNVERMTEAANVFADAATRILETMITSQQQTAKAITMTVRKTAEARGLIEDYHRRRGGDTRGSLQRATDGQVVELPNGMSAKAK